MSTAAITKASGAQGAIVKSEHSAAVAESYARQLVAYRIKETSAQVEAALSVWSDALEGYAPDVILEATRRATRAEKWPPNPAVICGHCDDVLRDRREAEAAAVQAEQAREYRAYLRREEAEAEDRARVIASWPGPTSDPAEAVERFAVLARHRRRPVLLTVFEVQPDGPALRITCPLGEAYPLLGEYAAAARSLLAEVFAGEVTS